MANKVVLITLAILFCGVMASAETTTVFSGLPLTKISEGGVSRVVDNELKPKTNNLFCVIIKRNNKYYWGSRNNKELLKHDTVGYTTYVAKDGSGYVRILNKDTKVNILIVDPTEKTYDYVEHITLGLKSVTYYGIFENI